MTLPRNLNSLSGAFVAIEKNSASSGKQMFPQLVTSDSYYSCPFLIITCNVYGNFIRKRIRYSTTCFVARYAVEIIGVQRGLRFEYAYIYIYISRQSVQFQYSVDIVVISKAFKMSALHITLESYLPL